MIDFTPNDEEVIEGYEKLLAIYVKLPLIFAIFAAVTIFVVGIVDCVVSENMINIIYLFVSPLVGLGVYWINKIALVPMILPVSYLKKMATQKSLKEDNE